ncbi:DUF6456 domain-containing protein [Pararhizobium sp.]|uniref:DUF6456 domain-containing protein n=1 Tax=Pararhizobium sp. TaxID=1977563 RepID=UPI00271E799F|nr:DUF6456 domain-containing protein [Pararhizobium sp.]MDO9417315.1 DUF6456 domain-containing protein [Pararhizobium sp.]
MSDQKKAPARNPAKALLALLRHVAGHRVTIRAGQGDIKGEGAPVTLERAGQAPRSFDRALLRRAIASGLLVAAKDDLRATPQAAAFIRRALVEPDAAFQDQHRDLRQTSVLVGSLRTPVRINDSESPLAALARLKDKSGQAFLHDDAIAAGERLHADFMRAQLQPRLTMSYEPRLSSKTKGMANAAAELSDTALAARHRVEKAIDAMGPELSGVALDVCCFMKGLELVERERQWPARSAKLMLRTALMALARHHAPPPAARRRIQSWGADGFRPVF